LITPNVETVKDPKEGQKKVKKIGIGPVQEFESYRFDPFTSVGYAFEELTYITVMTYKALFSMVTGAVSAKESVTGPIGIFYIVNSAANEGISHLFYILAVISASLAIFNLLPVIPLDGGHLFLLGIEKVRGKPLPEKIEEGVARVGFSLIICLAVFVFYSDFSRFGWIERILNLWK